jgi:hypothetical protein
MQDEQFGQLLLTMAEMVDCLKAIRGSNASHGKGILETLSLTGEGLKLPAHHVQKNGEAYLATYKGDVATVIPGIAVEFTLAKVEMFEKEDKRKGGTTHKFQIECRTDGGILPLEVGASAAFACGIVRQISYLMSTGFPFAHKSLLLEFAPGTDGAIFANFSTELGPVILPKGSGGLWKMRDVETTNQPWYKETTALLKLLRPMGLAAEVTIPSELWLTESAMNAPSLSAIADVLKWIEKSPLADDIDPKVLSDIKTLLGHKKTLMEQHQSNPVQLLAVSDDEMKRAGWGPGLGRSALEQRYNLRSRQELSDPQLFDFVAYLMTQ